MNMVYATTTRLLALAALVLSCYLTYASLAAGEVFGCSFGAFDCDAALGSRWGKWFGLPVAAGGVACYAVALAGAALAGREGRSGGAGWWLLAATSVLAIGAGVWFVTVQAVWLKSYCLYCLATHACGLGMAIAGWLWRADSRRELGQAWPVAAVASVDPTTTPPPKATESAQNQGIAVATGLAGALVLVVGQLLYASPTSVEVKPELDADIDLTEPPASEPPATDPPSPDSPSNTEAESPVAMNPVSAAPAVKKPAGPPKRRPNGSRRVALLGGALKIDAYDHPILGSPEAEHIMVELMDYACPHCREFHEKLEEAQRRFNGQVAVVVMPVPGEITCNPYIKKARKESAGACFAAKLALLVARLAPEEFGSFHHWMLQDDKIPQKTSALVQARERLRNVDNNLMRTTLGDESGELAARLKQYVQLAGLLSQRGQFGLPTQILGDKLIVGPPKTVDEVCEQWSEAFGIEPSDVQLPF